MKFFLKSTARYSLLLLALGGGIGPVIAQQNDTNTTDPGSTPPANTRTMPGNLDTIKPPPTGTNPNNRTLPNTGNPADTMSTNRALPPEGREGRVRTDSMPNNQGNSPNQGSAPTQGTPRRSTNAGTAPTPRSSAPQSTQKDSIERRMVPRADGTVRDVPLDSIGKETMPNDRRGTTPSPGAPRDSTDKRMMPNDGKSTGQPSPGMRPKAMDKSKTMDKNKSTATMKPKAKAGTNKKATTKTKRRISPAQGTRPGTTKKATPSTSTPSTTTPPPPKAGGGN